MATNSAENVREFYRKQGEQRERERIIKLLESIKCIDLDYEAGEQCLCGSWTEAIALIKGENN